MIMHMLDEMAVEDYEADLPDNGAQQTSLTVFEAEGRFCLGQAQHQNRFQHRQLVKHWI